jgi:predicted hotdog family 3-hydroxylacyl-ACP dehydratase
MNCLVKKESILDYIPQRAPMVMVDELLSANEVEQKAISTFFIRADNIFCENGFFKEPGLTENIAQSCALRAGYMFKQKNEKVPLGFIGAIKNLKVYFYPKSNTKIFTSIAVITEVFDVTLVKGCIYSEDLLAAECEMKIVLKKD